MPLHGSQNKIRGTALTKLFTDSSLDVLEHLWPVAGCGCFVAVECFLLVKNMVTLVWSGGWVEEKYDCWLCCHHTFFLAGFRCFISAYLFRDIEMHSLQLIRCVFAETQAESVFFQDLLRATSSKESWGNYIYMTTHLLSRFGRNVPMMKQRLLEKGEQHRIFSSNHINPECKNCCEFLLPASEFTK